MEESQNVFKIMANALGVTMSEFYELLNEQKSHTNGNLSNFCLKIEDMYNIALP